MRFGGPRRSLVAMRKRARTLRVHAGDPVGGGNCECGPNVLLTEDSQPILTELGEYTTPES